MPTARKRKGGRGKMRSADEDDGDTCDDESDGGGESDDCEPAPARARSARQPPPPRRPQGQPLKCFRCGRAGHLAPNCDRRRASGTPFPVCLRCGRSGHASAQCGGAGTTALPPAAGANQGVYVLMMTGPDGGKRYYVGKSLDISRRVQEHIRGESSCGIRPGDDVRRVPPATHGSVGDMEAWERGETLHRMRAHGVSRVRGWRFTARGDLPPALEEAAFAEVCERFDLCRRCGHGGHFAADCYASARAPWAASM